MKGKIQASEAATSREIYPGLWQSISSHKCQVLSQCPLDTVLLPARIPAFLRFMPLKHGRKTCFLLASLQMSYNLCLKKINPKGYRVASYEGILGRKEALCGLVMCQRAVGLGLSLGRIQSHLNMFI